MSQAIRTGAASAVTQGRANYDPINGAQIVDVHEGDASGINSVIGNLGDYQRFELDNSNAPIYQLAVYTYLGGPTPTVGGVPVAAGTPVVQGGVEAESSDVWELTSNLTEKDILECPFYSAVTQHDIAAIKAWLKSPNTNQWPAITGAGVAGELAWMLFNLLLKGTRKYFSEDIVLRYTLTVSSKNVVKLAYSRSDWLFSTTELLNPLIVGFQMPAGIVQSIGQIPNRANVAEILLPSGSTPIVFYYWSWLKRRPSSRQTKSGTLVITGEWWLNLWPIGPYTANTPPVS